MLPTTTENVFALQSVQSALPICALNVPATHARQGPPSAPVYPRLHKQTALEPPDCEFAGQLEHAPTDVAPATAENVLAEQLVHTAAPITGLYVPGTHRAHGPPFGPLAPVLHVQLVTTELPTVAEKLFAGQSAQLSLPLTPLYFPAPHSTQTLPFPVAPTLHRHSALDIPAFAFAAHATQAVAPTPAMYMPAAHDVQLVSAIPFLNLPASQSSQLPSDVAL